MFKKTTTHRSKALLSSFLCDKAPNTTEGRNKNGGGPNNAEKSEERVTKYNKKHANAQTLGRNGCQGRTVYGFLP